LKHNIPTINPTLEISRPARENRQLRGWGAVWKHPKTKKINSEALAPNDLLALKIASEGSRFKPEKYRRMILPSRVNLLLAKAVNKGLLISPLPKIKRHGRNLSIPDRLRYADTFTLQWHITNACGLHCRHCYDRTKRSRLALPGGIKILADLSKFCLKYRVRGHVCFTGGNPFLHPHFQRLYRKASGYGFSTSILGNPVSEHELVKIIDIQMPGYFQVSLEGLAAHNDQIRGKGHFRRTLKFLKTLRRLNISSAVMLTLTENNINEVIPLADKLRKYADYFTFNRLSSAGEGAALNLPDKKKYAEFLKKYVSKSRQNRIIGFKDNLINIVLKKRKMRLFDGCTGYGCGAAFNFLAVLSDGEVHACRKFSSPLGNIFKTRLSKIYESGAAKRYRRGAKECAACNIRHACGGCLAAGYSKGIKIFDKRDPYCFY